MHISGPFIQRPVATTLLTIALAMAGILAFQFLPVSPLPQVEYPTISVSSSLPGASPETMASAVATPLERQFSRIAGVTEMTSSSSLGSTNVTMQFELSRNVDAAARDVQAAINAARGQLPANLPNNPNYRKVNPAESPILMLGLTSDTMEIGRVYDAASTVLAQKLAQVKGVGQVNIGGGANPAVRVELNPAVLNKYGVGLDQVRAVLASANANRPKGRLADGKQFWTISTTDQLFTAAEYRPLVISYRRGAALRLSDVADVQDSIEDLRTAGSLDGKRAVLVMINRQPGANIIETVDRVKELLPNLKASISPAINMLVANDRSAPIRASLKDVERTMVLSIVLVILVVFVFLRNVRTTMIPSVSVPLSLIGTFGVMYLLGYSIDNMSLMALTISTGFVVDDAIVVIENISRYREQGMSSMQAAMVGSQEIGFTVLSMSTSLVAVFIPILLMGGIVGRLFREFAVTLSAAIVVSLLVSLSTTPMLCARFLKAESEQQHGWLYRVTERGFQNLRRSYGVALEWVLGHSPLVLVLTIATICLNIYLFVVVPKGFFPQQDNGRLNGSIQASQDVSFQAMREKLSQYISIVRDDPDVVTVQGFTGGGGFGGGAANTGRMFIALKPIPQRKVSSDQVMARLRSKLSRVQGANLFLQPVQDLRIGGRMSGSLYQFTLQGDNLQDLNEWAPRMLAKLRSLPQLVDVNSDQQIRGLEANLVIDRDTASRLKITPQMIDESLYDAFGQRPVSVMYRQLNQYRVIMEAAPRFWQSPETLRTIYVRSTTGAEVPLSAFTQYRTGNRPLSITHQSQFPSITFSFNLPVGVALGQAVDAVSEAQREMGLPSSVRATFQGAAQAFQDSLANEPLLVLFALIAVYIVLGVLYESMIHPITILSTLPSAGVGAILALLLTKTELSVIAMIGIILLIGIVEKNAIMMIDFALAAQRKTGKNPREAIFEACLLRFRPITMTTMAALLGGLPLALGTGTGSEMRRPLGIAIVGGLIVSQMMTLFTTPVVYLYMDRLGQWLGQRRSQLLPRPNEIFLTKSEKSRDR